MRYEDPRKPYDPLDSLVEDILNASDEEMLAEAVEDYGSVAAMEAEFDRIVFGKEPDTIAAVPAAAVPAVAPPVAAAPAAPAPVAPANEAAAWRPFSLCAQLAQCGFSRASDVFISHRTAGFSALAFAFLLVIALDVRMSQRSVLPSLPPDRDPFETEAFLPKMPPPETSATAPNLGSLRQGGRIVRRVRLLPNDGAYYAKFSLQAPSSVSIDLSEDGQQSELNMALFKEVSGQRTEQKSSVPGTAGRRISADLDAGTYFVWVRRSSDLSSTSRFTLSLHGQVRSPDLLVDQGAPEADPGRKADLDPGRNPSGGNGDPVAATHKKIATLIDRVAKQINADLPCAEVTMVVDDSLNVDVRGSVKTQDDIAKAEEIVRQAGAAPFVPSLGALTANGGVGGHCAVPLNAEWSVKVDTGGSPQRDLGRDVKSQSRLPDAADCEDIGKAIMASPLFAQAKAEGGVIGFWVKGKRGVQLCLGVSSRWAIGPAGIVDDLDGFVVLRKN
jgi:hypothetical protein